MSAAVRATGLEGCLIKTSVAYIVTRVVGYSPKDVGIVAFFCSRVGQMLTSLKLEYMVFTQVIKILNTVACEMPKQKGQILLEQV